MLHETRTSSWNGCLKLLLLSLGIGLTALACGDDGGGITPGNDAGVDAMPDPEGNPFGIALTHVSYELDELFGGRLETNRHGVGSGAAVADVDGDGDLDVFVARCVGDVTDPGGDGGPSTLYRQTGPGDEFPVFTSDPLMTAAFADSCAHGAAFGDYDLDGHADLFVAMAGEDRLYRNDGAGVFTDVTATAGVAGPAGDINTSGYWADVNHDGLLDLLVPAHTPVFPPSRDPLNANRLYINLGDGTFSRLAPEAGFDGNGSTQAVAIGNLDDDSDLEIYIANDQFAVNGVLPAEVDLDKDLWLDVASYDTSGVPTYTDRAAAYNVDGPRSSMGIAIADVNDDGHQDIFISDFGSNHMQIWNPATSQYDDQAVDLRVDLKDALLLGFLISWDATFSDLDRDGSHELIIIHGSITTPNSGDDYTQFDYVMRYEPIVSRFLDITLDVGLPFDEANPPQDDRPLSGRGVLLADLDGDHDDDVIVTPYVEKFRFYRNDTPQTDRHFVRVEPRGTVSAPTPIGAVLEVTRTDGSVVRRSLHAGGTNTQHFGVLEAGLGGDTSIQSATLHWPSGYTQRVDMTSGFALDTTLKLEEPKWLTLSKRSAPLADDDVEIVYTPMDAAGNPIGAGAAGRTVQALLSSGGQVTLDDNGDGTYSALLPDPGAPRITVVQVADEGVTLRPRLTVNYK